ncbi:MAG: monodechloroaminopyrrolnitrin synthase PrnB family protein [Chloroflexota bacterium]
MSDKLQAFDHWIRTEFAALNTDLEQCYFAQEDKANVEGVGIQKKNQLRDEGHAFIQSILDEDFTDQPLDTAFDLLGNVGFYMAACRRHEVLELAESTQAFRDASTLAIQLSRIVGMTPRLASAHITTHNKAVNGVCKRFTTLPDEMFFIQQNTQSIFAYKRAADALLQLLPLGISHPITADLLQTAQQALEDVLKTNHALFDGLDTETFFYSIRPYYKSYRVGVQVYRGINAGDFAGVNVIDLLLGLCFADEPFYAAILADKIPYMVPEEQCILQHCMDTPNLMDAFLQAQQSKKEQWYQTNLALFLAVCSLHGEITVQHHHRLVAKYVANPAKRMARKHVAKVTASGLPLQKLMTQLEKLRDCRVGKQRDDIRTRYHDLNTLKASLNEPSSVDYGWRQHDELLRGAKTRYRIHSPRLVNREDAKHFVKEMVVEED